MWFERANSLLQGLFESTPDGHDFADGLHLRAESAVRAGEFFELPFGDFYDDVVDGRLEAGRSLLGDVVGNFVQRHAHGEARGDFRDGETGGFAGERGAARDARVHFDHDHAAVFRIDGELDVRTARFDADFANDRGGRVAHALIFLVGQSLRGSDSDGVPGVNAHWIEILDGADDHEVVAVIAHDFELVFFPTEDGFFDERFVNGAHIESVGDGFAKFFFVVGDGATGAAERERRANDERKAELIAEAQGVLCVIDERGRGHFETDFAAGVLEPQAVFGDFDGAQRSANHFDFVLFENSAFGELDGEIKRSLTANSRQERVRFFAFENLLEIFLRERLDVGAVGQFRIGHDGRGIGIDEHDFVPFSAQRFAGLRTGIVEFAGLPDDNGPRTDNQDFLDVSAFWHRLWANSL